MAEESRYEEWELEESESEEAEQEAGMEATEEGEMEEESEAYGYEEAEEWSGEAAAPARRPPPYGGLQVARRGVAPPARAKGFRYATVRTPAGEARIKLPAPVPTVREMNVATQRLAQQVARQEATIRRLDAEVSAGKKTARRMERSGVRATNAGLLVLFIDQVKEVVTDIFAARTHISLADEQAAEDDVLRRKVAETEQKEAAARRHRMAAQEAAAEWEAAMRRRQEPLAGSYPAGAGAAQATQPEFHAKEAQTQATQAQPQAQQAEAGPQAH